MRDQIYMRGGPHGVSRCIHKNSFGGIDRVIVISEPNRSGYGSGYISLQSILIIFILVLI